MSKEKPNKYKFQKGLASSILCALALLITLAPFQSVHGAAPIVSPGETIILGRALRGGNECFIYLNPRDCDRDGGRWGNTVFDNNGLIRGEFSPEIPHGIAGENRAIAWLDYHFMIEDSVDFPGGLVNTEIAVKYNFIATLLGASAYSDNTLLTMTLSEGTPAGDPFIASATLWDANRQGDQGFTDVALGGESHVSTGEVSNLTATLKRGVEYKIRIAAQGSASVLLLGKPLSSMEAKIDYVRVQVSEDEIEQLRAHDSGIRNVIAAHEAVISSQLSTHDKEIKSELASHDADIKALLVDIKGGIEENQRLIKIFKSRQLEIMRLLITPNGNREINENVLTCTGDNCPTYPGYRFCKNGSRKWNCTR